MKINFESIVETGLTAINAIPSPLTEAERRQIIGAVDGLRKKLAKCEAKPASRKYILPAMKADAAMIRSLATAEGRQEAKAEQEISAAQWAKLNETALNSPVVVSYPVQGDSFDRHITVKDLVHPNGAPTAEFWHLWNNDGLEGEMKLFNFKSDLQQSGVRPVKCADGSWTLAVAGQTVKLVPLLETAREATHLAAVAQFRKIKQPVSLMRETEKAYQFRISRSEIWFPKSRAQIRDGMGFEVFVDPAMAAEKGIEVE